MGFAFSFALTSRVEIPLKVLNGPSTPITSHTNKYDKPNVFFCFSTVFLCYLMQWSRTHAFTPASKA